MVLKSRQKLWHKIALSWVTIIVLTLFAILLANGVYKIYKKNLNATKKADYAQAELAKVVERQKSISKDLEHIKTSAGIEEELRRKFDVSKAGEHLLVIVDKEVEPEAPTKKESWWQSLWRKLVE